MSTVSASLAKPVVSRAARRRFTRLVAIAGLAAAVVGCGDDEDPRGRLNDRCAPDDSHACIEGLVCSEVEDATFACRIPLGGHCNLQAAEPVCVTAGVCTAVPHDEGEGEHGECRVPEAGVCDPTAPFCAPGLVCDPRDDDLYACYRPVRLVGVVLDSSTEDPIEGAHVIALDGESVAVSDVAESGEDGTYSLVVPAVRQATDAEGRPVAATYTLRAQAHDYQTFPGGIRTALPIHTSLAVRHDDVWIIESALTTIVLIPLPDPDAARYFLAGEVHADEGEAGVLIVAEGGGEAYTAITDRRGRYVVFNVPPGTYEVAGYAADLQLERVNVTVVDEAVLDVDLHEIATPLTNLSGSVQIVNAPGGSRTTVILVVASTFSGTFGRGESPRGLRAPRTGPPSITGAWRLEGVPDGTYVVLAAFENDDLVRDPDLNIGGTDTITVTVAGSAQAPEMTLGQSFKVTEALDVIAPGAEEPEEVTSAPELVWQNDTSEAWYEVRVFDAFGELVWEDLSVPAVSGQSPPISVTYGGPLEPGMYYQFRAMSWRQPSGQPASPISATEDLRGVFFVPAED
jgi:hypothetical protein